MMNEKQIVLIHHSSFIIHHSSFAFMSRYENRAQLALALVVGLLLLANLFTLTLVALTPQTRAARAPVLLTVFAITLLVSVPCGLVAFDARGRTTIINAPARALLGVGGAAEGQPVETLLSAAPELAEL